MDRPTSAGSDARHGGVLRVYATHYPLAFFAERIGGKDVEVSFSVPAGVDPAHWSPDPEEVVRAQRADVLLRSGAGDPAWLGLASLYPQRVVDTSARVRERLLRRETARHQHGPGGDHSHSAWAGSPWLDPTLAVAQAQAVAEAFTLRRPELEDFFRTNLAALERELDDLDQALQGASAAIGATPLLYSHPVYVYLQKRYGLNGMSVRWEPEQIPSESQWRALAALLERHPARVMLWEDEPLPEVAVRLASLGVTSRVYAPCANRPVVGDWLTVMRANARALAEVADPVR